MALDPNRLCKCHGIPMLKYRCHQGYLCAVKRRATANRAQKRYWQTAKGQKADARYKGSAKGKATAARSRKRRIYAGYEYHGRVKSVDHAERINDHIRRRLSAFKSRFQKRTEVEGVTTSGVQAEAELRADRLGRGRADA